MTVQAANLELQAEKFLTILNGSEAGVAYKIVGKKLTIGRAGGNDVVLQDAKASRRHVMIEAGDDGTYSFKDLGSQNGIAQNGQIVRGGILQDGDILIIGQTQIRFGSAPTQTALAPVRTASPVSTPQGSAPLIQPSLGLPPMGTRSTSSKPQNLFIIFGIVALVVVAAIIFQSRQASRKLMLKDDAKIQETLDATDQETAMLEKEINRKGKDTPEYQQAQSFYLRGFREFREGNYIRANQNFETALTLYPQHQLASRYLVRSRQKLNEAISQALERGEKAFQLEKYGMALNDYRTVLLLNTDPKSKSAILAKKRIETIELIEKSQR